MLVAHGTRNHKGAVLKVGILHLGTTIVVVLKGFAHHVFNIAGCFLSPCFEGRIAVLRLAREALVAVFLKVDKRVRILHRVPHGFAVKVG